MSPSYRVIVLPKIFKILKILFHASTPFKRQGMILMKTIISIFRVLPIKQKTLIAGPLYGRTNSAC